MTEKLSEPDLATVAIRDGVLIAQLDDLLARGPQIEASERAAMLEDVRELRSQLRNARSA